MEKILYKISKVIVIILAFLCVLILFPTVHELTHYYDVKKIDNVVVNSVCFIGFNSLNEQENFMDTAVGWVEASNIKEIDYPSENKANIIAFCVFSFFIFFIFKFMFAEED